MTIKFYSWPHSSGTRVAWALEELGLAYEYIKLDAKKQDHRSPEYLALNPHGKVPVLVDGSQFFSNPARSSCIWAPSTGSRRISFRAVAVSLAPTPFPGPYGPWPSWVPT
jgi:glutaredoxin